VKFSEIDAARKLLGLGETATLAEIKNAYRIMAHQYHPDKGEDHAPGNERLMTELNLAYKLLMDYCDGYRYSFKETEAA
jgi:DnaJ family protein C protein 3